MPTQVVWMVVAHWPLHWFQLTNVDSGDNVVKSQDHAIDIVQHATCNVPQSETGKRT